MDKLNLEKVIVGVRQRKVAKIQQSFWIVYGSLVLITIGLILTMWM